VPTRSVQRRIARHRPATDPRVLILLARKEQAPLLTGGRIQNEGDYAVWRTTIIFTGVVTEDQIAFSRKIQGEGRPRPFPGMLSPVGVLQFTVRRVPDGMPPKRTRGTPFPQQLTVYDRRGEIVQRLGEPDVYNWPVFSPDGRRLAVGHRGHISVFDLAGGMRTRVTSPPWLTFAPA
jgi:hypothetical protein